MNLSRTSPGMQAVGEDSSTARIHSRIRRKSELHPLEGGVHEPAQRPEVLRTLQCYREQSCIRNGAEDDAKEGLSVGEQDISPD